MVYLIDLIRGEKLDRYVARNPTDVIAFLKQEDPRSAIDFLLRMEKVEESGPDYVRESPEAVKAG